MSNTQNDYSELYGFKEDNNAIASPGAQTFTAPHDAFLKSVNLYFRAGKTPDPGITMEIRNVINGVPGDKYYARTSLQSNQIRVDSTGQTPTTFNFNNPIFLQNGKQYAIVLYTASVNYQLAVSVLGEYSNNAQANITTEDINANQEVHGTFCYSMDGNTWNTGDPTTHMQNAANGTLCLKFDVNTAIFDTSNKNDVKEFTTIPLNNNQSTLNDINYSARNTDQTMNNLSYLTFLPSVFTPNNTSVNWQYSFDEPSENGAQPLAKNTTITVPSSTKSINNIYVWATMNGSSNVSPVINTGSMNFTVQATNTDNDKRATERQDMSLTYNGEDATNPFTNRDDSINAGEYISRDIDFKRQNESHNSSFDQIYASYEYQSNGTPRPSLYFNLNANNDSQNPYNSAWIPLVGYDTLCNWRDKNGVHSKHYLIDPYNPGSAIDPQTGLVITDSNILQDAQSQTYSQVITSDLFHPETNWVRYHFYVSLKRLFNLYQHNCPNTFYSKSSDSRHSSISTQYPLYKQNASNGNAYEIEFKLVFHTDSIHNHPKVRKFRTSMNFGNQQSENEIQPN